MVEQKLFRYNKMYYIVSIGNDDNPSFDVADYVNNILNMGPSFCKKIVVEDINTWSIVMRSIIEESSSESIPIVFIECHGNKKGNLVVGKDEVRMIDFLNQMRSLEEKCEQKILLLTAVCHGLYFSKKMYKLGDTFPCSCVIGSYTVQSVLDIEYRYKAFLKVLLCHDCKGNVKSAFSAMKGVYKNNALLYEWSKGKRYVMLTSKRKYFLNNLL